ncbi:MAG: hypothetical protein P4L51_02690 [Puia sp.]|nr:hypothetical protein [Puia sp.]
MRSKQRELPKKGVSKGWVLACIVSGGVLFSVVGCSKTSADKLSGGSAACDTVGVQYSVQILSILQQNCYSCHGSGNTGGSGGIDLSSYAKLKVYADNGYLVGNVTHNPDPKYHPMPFGLPKLPDCEVNTIVAWVDQGAQNN